MGEKEGKEKKEKRVDGGEKKKEDEPIKVVLKVDMHCEGCASKIKRSVKGIDGVDGVTTDMASNKLTVTGKVDPWMLRDRVEAKTRKKVEIISPANPPKKDTDGGGQKPAAASGDKKPAAAAGDSKKQKKSNDKNAKESATSTVVLNIRLHCDGCIQRIKKTILKIQGVQEVNVEAQKDLVIVTGTMAVNSLPPYLKDKLKRGVEIVQAKIGGGGGGGGGGDKKDKAGGGGGGGEKKEEGGGGEKKEKEGGGGGGGGGKKEDAGKVAEAAALSATVAGATSVPAVAETNKMGGSNGYMVEMLHAPQLFSDENPNACSVM